MSQSSEKFKKTLNEIKMTEASKSESVSKLMGEEDSYFQAEETEAVAKPTVKATSFQIKGVRFTPKVIEFIDAFDGKQFSEKITIQNVGEKPVSLKIGEPRSFVFQLKRPSRRAKLLAAGSAITKTITYSFHNDDLVQKSQIPIQINGKLIEYPIIVKRATACVEIQPSKLNFRIINLGATARTLSLSIFNNGGKRTKFEIDLGKNDLDLVVNPLRGTIGPKSQIKVWVEMMGLSEGEFYKELWIKTSEMPIRVPVLVEVVRPRLQILHPNGTQDFTLINFGATFNESQKANSFVLKNYSAEATLFITLAEVNGELKFLKEARQQNQTFRMFMLTAEEGRLEPFEHRILTVLFRPKKQTTEKGWKHEEYERSQSIEHIVFFRMNRVHCIERKELAKVETKMNKKVSPEKSGSWMQDSFSLGSDNQQNAKVQRQSNHNSDNLDEDYMQKASNLTGDHSPLEEKVLRLCIHGKAIEPDVVILPSNLTFDAFYVGESKNRVLRLTNNSILGVKYSFFHVLNTRIKPKIGWLEPHGTMEVLVTVKPSSPGSFQTEIKIDILAESEVVFSGDKPMRSITTLVVPLSYTASVQLKAPSFKLGLGISQEILIQEKAITFLDTPKVPYAAKLLSETHKPQWMKIEPDQVNMVDNALMALPNDRPNTMPIWPKNKICRTIFAGLLRHAPPKDLTYADSSQTALHKAQHKAFWQNFLKLMRDERLKKHTNIKDFENTLQYYGISKSNKSLINFKDLQYNEAPLLTDSTSNKSIMSLFRKRDSCPRRALVPLSPLYLSNVTVEPKLINFNLVAAGTVVQEMLRIRNKNSFPIGIRFIPGKSAVMVLEGDTILISPMTTKSLQISFQTKDLGRHYGFLNYVINGSHEFKITISAFVTTKTLIVDNHQMYMEFGNWPEENAFQPRSQFMVLENMFQSPIRFHWSFPTSSIFNPSMIEGEVPPKFRHCTEVVFDIQPNKSFYAEANLFSESGNAELIRFVHTSKRVRVHFLTNRIDMNDIPLNLPTKLNPIIQNASYSDVSFQVNNWAPMPGVTVEPKQGVIKRRSFFPLDIKVQIPVIMKFAFEVEIIINTIEKISVKVTGNVVMPIIRMTPAEIVMRKVCVQSFDTVIICVENTGTTPSEVTLDLKGWPEYSVEDGRATLHLLPNKSSKFVVHFEPKDVARCLFYLPITINKILGPPMMQEPQTEYVAYYISSLERNYSKSGDVFHTENSRLKIPFVCVNCTVSPCLLQISSLNIHFRQTPKSKNQFQPQTLLISNQFAEKVTFCIRTDNLNQTNKSPFSLSPVVPHSVEYRNKALKSELKKGETLALTAIFSPKTAGLYTAKIPVFIRDYNNGTVYNYINLKGEFKKPKLYPESTEIHFPPLPLEVGCDAVLSICADNYHTAETLFCVIWDSREGAEPASDILTVTWISEPIVSTTCFGPQMFQLQVNFRSTSPVAFRGYLVILDTKGQYCTVFVTATADNSAVSTHAFLSTMTSKYRLIRDSPDQREAMVDDLIPNYRTAKSDLKKGEETKNVGEIPNEGTSSVMTTTNNACSLPIDKGPRLVVQVTKSMSRPTQLSFVNFTKNYNVCKNKGSSSTVLIFTRTKPGNSFVSRSDSYSGNASENKFKKNEPGTNFVSHPSFPFYDNPYAKHFHQTLAYAERWIFEVVMRCDQYFTIPYSFQKLRSTERLPARPGYKTGRYKIEKDFLDFLEEVAGPKVKQLIPPRLTAAQKASPSEKVERLYSFFLESLRFLESQGCLLPHIKPEFLFDYENYVEYCNFFDSWEVFKWKNIELEKINSLKILKETPMPIPRAREESFDQNLFTESKDSWKKSLFDFYSLESDLDIKKVDNGKGVDPEVNMHEVKPTRQLVENKSFLHQKEILDKASFDARTKQAWLDIVIQIFRNFVLTKVTYMNTIPKTQAVEMGDRLDVETVDLSYLMCTKKPEEYTCAMNMESSGSNIYSVQERILLTWLNHHFNLQKKILWKDNTDELTTLNCRVINNFDKDLADSVALIALTASHCPYIVSYFFLDVFGKPDTPTKMSHNAAKLVMAWRFLNVGITVESNDIVRPNPVFMIMLVTQLYNVLPSFFPRSIICFSAPLTTELTRTITLRNDSPHRIYYTPKFLGEEDDMVFRLNESSLIELKPFRTSEINIIFTARKIKKISATLLLSGCVISPHFGKDMAFYLEGQPSTLSVVESYTLSIPLYRVIDTDIMINCPYPEPAIYELWYTTKEPKFRGDVDISKSANPWSKISKRKVSRRLFLNQEEVNIKEDGRGMLNITASCLTEEERFFWILLRNPKFGDFIILINIITDTKTPVLNVKGIYPENWMPVAFCTCPRYSERLSPSPSSPTCPLTVELKIPTRNDDLWNALAAMFFKSLEADEETFWSEHFEENIGICLILWMLSPEEEEAVVDEFVHVLLTKDSFRLKVLPPHEKLVQLPERIEIEDLRERSHVMIPAHLSHKAPPKLKFTFTMTSENGKEVRTIKAFIAEQNNSVSSDFETHDPSNKTLRTKEHFPAKKKK